MRTEITVGLYNDHFETILKWYGLAFKDKKPNKTDEYVYKLITIILEDIIRDDKENEESG